MNNYTVVDIETRDPYIKAGMGSGWVYAYNDCNDLGYEVLGVAVAEGERSDYIYQPNGVGMLATQNTLVAHNAAYDIGGLLSMGFDFAGMKVYDTLVMSKLYDSSIQSHTLDFLGKKYIGESKSNDELCEVVWDSGLYQEVRSKELDRNVKTRPNNAALEKFAKEHMKELHTYSQETFEVVRDYAIQDVLLTQKLFEFFSAKVDMQLALKYSMLVFPCVEYRKRGVRVDLNKAKELETYLGNKIDELYDEVYEIAGEEFKILSNKQFRAVLDKLGISYDIRESTGNAILDSDWLSKQSHPLCKAISSLKKNEKINNDFVIKLQTMLRNGRVYPELNLLAARTGRFSCKCPNIQQIPKRDPELGPLVRGLFLPEPGEKWYSIDFSNQEGRLQIHYAYLTKCEGADVLVDKLTDDPNYSMHKEVAEYLDISIKDAKAINLGISYGMGIDKLAAMLGTTVHHATDLRNGYYDKFPYLKELNEYCKISAIRKGYIRTIGGRELRTDKPKLIDGKVQKFEYKSLNKLMQGSAADQTINAMIKAYEEGLPVMFPVHDELCMSGTEEQALRLKKIMEEAVDLAVPSVAEISVGNSWGEAL